MNDNVTQTSMFGTEKIYKILLQLAPPVMFAQLIQALYNIVDSYFVGKYSPRRADCPLRDLSDTAYHHGARGRNRCRRQHADGAAVTVLGLYYKMQTFFFIPLLGLQTCIVPVLSYNYAAKKYKRCQTILNESVLFSMLFMLIGVFCFELLPARSSGCSRTTPTCSRSVSRLSGSSVLVFCRLWYRCCPLYFFRRSGSLSICGRSDSGQAAWTNAPLPSPRPARRLPFHPLPDSSSCPPYCPSRSLP